MNRRKLVRYAVVAFCVMALILFLELASSIVLDKVVNPTRLERFDDIYAHSLDEFNMLPHPFLKYVEPFYIAEKERYLRHVAQNQLQDNLNVIYIVAMGGSTTQRGYPRYTERYLNGKLRELNSSLEVVVFNFGVAGWNTFQSVQNYFYLLKYLHPDFIITHENHNEGQVEHFFNANAVEYYPDISPFERALVRRSSFYKLLKFTYLLTYNSVRYDEEVRFYTLMGGDKDYPMPARISAYINDKGPTALLPLFFERDFIRTDYPPEGFPREFMFTENYESLIRYARADGAEVLMTTQYQNHSKAAPGKYDSTAVTMNEESRATNDIIRKVSKKNSVPLVDLARDMVEYDYSMIDEVHFSEVGIKAKGELIGAKVWEIMEAKYNLTGDGSGTARSASGLQGFPPAQQSPHAAERKEIRSFAELPIASGTEGMLLVDDFEHGDLGLYVQETQKAEMDYEIPDNAGIKGRCLQFHYQFDPSSDFRSADLARKFIQNGGVRAWLAYDYLNFAFKVQNTTDLLRVIIVEKDGDWWNFINKGLFDADRWYWVKVPLRELFILEDFSIQGDGVQDWSSVAELRFVFDSTDLTHNQTENTAYIDEIFLTG